MNMPIREQQQGFQTLVNDPNTMNGANMLWKSVERLVDKTTDTLTNTVSIFDVQGVIDSINSRWESVYTNETQAKAYLDVQFPLETGSHSDVKSYVVYYHHLLAFLEDGTQTGLANPKQFVALCGHKCAPDSLVLKSGDLHTEIVINQTGSNGEADKSNVQDVRVENAVTTIINLDKKISASSDFGDAYASLIALLTGQYTSTKGLANTAEITFTDVDGDDYVLNARTPIVIQGASDIKAVFA